MIDSKDIRRVWNDSIAALCEKGRAMLAGGSARRVSQLRELAPYAAMEILLPGGSLLALILWLARRRLKKRSASESGKPSIRAIKPSPIIVTGNARMAALRCEV